MNGLLLLDKPSGFTSHDLVARVRRALGTREVGHSGTLDPMASGLMVLLIGEATKLSHYITEGDKAYHVGFKLGITTDTLDTTGQITAEKNVDVGSVQVIDEAKKLVGLFTWDIPLFSAKKVDGRKLYEYARSETEVKIPQKEMRFWDVQVVGESNELIFSVECSKGSFIRTWVNELGKSLGCGAAMSFLRRTKSHAFQLNEALTLEKLESLSNEEKLKALVPIDQSLRGVKSIRVKGQDETLLKNGQISHQLRSQLISMADPSKDEIFQILPQKKGALLALVGLEKEVGFKVKRVFNC